MSEFWRSFEKRNPILAPALEATYHFSKKQLLMNLVLAVLAIPVSLYYELIPWLQLKASIKVVAIVYVGLLIATALYNFVRSPLRLLGRNNEQIAELQERLTRLTQSLEAIGQVPRALPSPDTRAEAVPAQMSAASIEFTNSDVVIRWLSDSGLTSDRPRDEREAQLFMFQVVLARFYYKPDRDVPPTTRVRAQVIITDSQGTMIKPRYDAVWDVGSYNEYKEFSTADTHALALALLPQNEDQALSVYEYGYRDRQFRPSFPTVAGQEFVLEINLIGKVKDATVLNSRMRFLLTLEPQPELSLLD